MASRSKPALTGSAHTLPFEKLAPLDFERLCLWLIGREGYARAEHLGEAGSEGGRDVLAWKDERRIVFQCKRVKAFTAAHARAEIGKLRALPIEEQPHELVFVVSQATRAETRRAARETWGDEATCHFWCGSELDERVKRHPDLLAEFFQLPSVKRRTGFVQNLPYASLGNLFQGRETMLERLHESLAAAPAGRATAIAGKAVHGLGGIGKTRLAVEYAWRHAAKYSAMLFVGAESPADLRQPRGPLRSRRAEPHRAGGEGGGGPRGGRPALASGQSRLAADPRQRRLAGRRGGSGCPRRATPRRARPADRPARPLERRGGADRARRAAGRGRRQLSARAH